MEGLQDWFHRLVLVLPAPADPNFLVDSRVLVVVPMVVVPMVH